MTLDIKVMSEFAFECKCRVLTFTHPLNFTSPLNVTSPLNFTLYSPGCGLTSRRMYAVPAAVPETLVSSVPAPSPCGAALVRRTATSHSPIRARERRGKGRQGRKEGRKEG